MKQRKTLLYLVFVLFCILLVACGRNRAGLHEIGNTEFAQILEREGVGTFVYIGRPTCELCYVFEPILQETLQELGMPMYYFQTDQARQTDEDKMLELLEPLNIDGIPIIIYVIEGYVVDYIIGPHQSADIVAFIEANNITN